MLVHTLRRVVAWALGLVLVGSTATALGVALFPVVTGGQALAVLSGSMSPGLPVGAMAFVRPVDPTTVGAGDVVTFQRAPDAPELVTHRVLAVDTSSGAPVFRTKGDANEDPDVDPVPASAIRGELLLGVPHLGRMAALLHSPKGVGLLIVLICAAVAASPGPRPGTADDAPEDTPAPEVDAADARTVVMAPVTRDGTVLVQAGGRPLPPLPRVPQPVPARD